MPDEQSLKMGRQVWRVYLSFVVGPTDTRNTNQDLESPIGEQKFCPLLAHTEISCYSMMGCASSAVSVVIPSDTFRFA